MTERRAPRGDPADTLESVPDPHSLFPPARPGWLTIRPPDQTAHARSRAPSRALRAPARPCMTSVENGGVVSFRGVVRAAPTSTRKSHDRQSDHDRCEIRGRSDDHGSGPGPRRVALHGSAQAAALSRRYIQAIAILQGDVPRGRARAVVVPERRPGELRVGTRPGTHARLLAPRCLRPLCAGSSSARLDHLQRLATRLASARAAARRNAGDDLVGLVSHRAARRSGRVVADAARGPVRIQSGGHGDRDLVGSRSPLRARNAPRLGRHTRRSPVSARASLDRCRAVRRRRSR